MSFIKNKKGMLRIVEATIAILLVFGFLIVVQARNREIVNVDFSENIYDLLEEISKDISLRDSVFLNGEGVVSEGVLYDFVSERLPSYLNFEIRICNEIDKICSMDNYIDGEVYSGQRVLVQSVNGLNDPLKLSIFAWRSSDEI